MDFRVVISDPKSGKAHQVELKEPGATKLIGRKIGDKIEGDFMGMPGYKLEITGGSDREGFPMRSDLPGTKRRKILLAGGIGYHPTSEGRKRRKTVRGRDIAQDVGQLNVKVVEYGSKSLEVLFGIASPEEAKK
ncbi:MAG: 30S ribosomal protein S6e [Methanosarcinales archaeon]|nr:30S ribosomal protein S6e [Methanosarcinales archaeon]